MKIALYARVSTKSQQTEPQLVELRAYCERRGLTITSEYVDEGWSGAKEKRPALDRLMADAKRRLFDAVVVWKFDRFARSVSHLLRALENFQSLGLDFISLTEGVDTSTPTGRMIFTVLGAVAELERSLIKERVCSGIKSTQERLKHGSYRRSDGRLVTHIGRKKGWESLDLDAVRAQRTAGESWRSIAVAFGVPESTIRKYLRKEQSNANASI